MKVPNPMFGDEAYLAKRTRIDQTTGCQEWLLSRVKGGYGKASIGGKTVIAHRALWEARKGQIPQGKLVCHKCDNPICVNLDHLFLGSPKENSEDMVIKCRQAKGERAGLSKLTTDVVLKLRSAVGPHRAVARDFGLKPGVVRQVRVGETWRHLL